MNKEARLKKLAQKLLATTCLTAAAAGMASATSFTESTDFTANSGSPTVLAAGTTSVLGGLSPDHGDSQDWFDIPGLSPGTTETVVITSSFTEMANIGDLSDGFNAIFGPTQVSSEGGTITTTVTVPADGDLVFGITTVPQAPGFDVNYTVNISGSTPEPGTFAAGALALAGAVALRRKRKQQA